MPRCARLRLPGYPHHVTQRGVDGAPCFRLPRDRHRYLGLLEELSPQFGCRVHAFVLMDNHVHLLVTPDRAEGCSELMRRLGQRYVQYFNTRHGRRGPLWCGRFFSSVVDTDRYLLRCQRYIEMNPVRAGMVGRPVDYPWSSFRTNAFGEPSTFLSPHEVFLSFGRTPQARSRSYLDLFEQPVEPAELEFIRSATRGGFAIGDSAFTDRLEAATGLRWARRRPGRPPRK